MKKFFSGIIILGFILTISSCAEMEKLDLSPISSKVPTGTVIGGGGFRSGEVLCAVYDDHGLMDNTYYVGKVMKPATPQTKNQAEVLFISDGEKKWTKYVIPSHKAEKSEIKLGMMVFRHVYAGSEDLSAESYRKRYWQLKRISSIDELFKGVVEADGKKSYVKWLRIPDQPLE